MLRGRGVLLNVPDLRERDEYGRLVEDRPRRVIGFRPPGEPPVPVREERRTVVRVETPLGVMELEVELVRRPEPLGFVYGRA